MRRASASWAALGVAAIFGGCALAQEAPIQIPAPLPEPYLPQPSAAPVEPKVGEYIAYEYFVSSTCPSGKSFGPSVPSAKMFYYPGPAKTGARFYSTQMDGNSVIYSQLPITPARGVTSWNGPVTTTIYPGGAKSTMQFTATLTYATANIFFATATMGPSCPTGVPGTDTNRYVFVSTSG